MADHPPPSRQSIACRLRPDNPVYPVFRSSTDQAWDQAIPNMVCRLSTGSARLSSQSSLAGHRRGARAPRRSPMPHGLPSSLVSGACDARVGLAVRAVDRQGRANATLAEGVEQSPNPIRMPYLCQAQFGRSGCSASPVGATSTCRGIGWSFSPCSTLTTGQTATFSRPSCQPEARGADGQCWPHKANALQGASGGLPAMMTVQLAGQGAADVVELG